MISIITRIKAALTKRAVGRRIRALSDRNPFTAAKLAKCYVISLEPGELAVQSRKTNLALNGADGRVEIIEQGASERSTS